MQLGPRMPRSRIGMGRIPRLESQGRRPQKEEGSQVGICGGHDQTPKRSKGPSHGYRAIIAAKVPGQARKDVTLNPKP